MRIEVFIFNTHSMTAESTLKRCLIQTLFWDRIKVALVYENAFHYFEFLSANRT